MAVLKPKKTYKEGSDKRAKSPSATPSIPSTIPFDTFVTPLHVHIQPEKNRSIPMTDELHEVLSMLPSRVKKGYVFIDSKTGEKITPKRLTELW